MAGKSTSNMSIWLYNNLCHNIVGSEDYVRLIRLINALTDRITSNTLCKTRITSGSFGEGLELKGSDLDIMVTDPGKEVIEQMKHQDYHSDKTYYLVETNDVKPGFAYLRLLNGNTKSERLLCREFEGHLYLSSVLFKMRLLSQTFCSVHGPCASDKGGYYDLAYCLHSKSWICTALKWVTRSNNSWPTSEVKQRVVAHGVMFVPIGTEGNLNEELKWRISFSGTHQDAVLGWLMLATLFYKQKHYYKALCALSYSLTKCTTEKLSLGANITDVHQKLFRYKIFKKLGIIRTLRFLFLSPIDFYEESNSIPEELKSNANDLKISFLIPPVAYLYLLTFLCHKHMHNTRNYQESLGDLRLIIEEEYCMSDITLKATAYDCLGVAFQIIGDTEAAREAFVKSTEIHPEQFENRSFKRLAVLNSCID